MAYKLKKEWEGKSIDNLNIPLNDLTQKQILGLNESIRNSLFVEETHKKTKKDVGKDTLFIDNIDISKDRIKVSKVFVTIGATKKDKERIIRDIGNPKYRDSYLYLTLKNMNYIAIKDGHWYLVKS